MRLQAMTGLVTAAFTPLAMWTKAPLGTSMVIWGIMVSCQPPVTLKASTPCCSSM